MATCKCGTVNEYADDAEYGKDGYTCYNCRDKAPGALHEGGVAVPSSVEVNGVTYAADPGTVAGGVIKSGYYVFRQGDFMVGREMPVRGPCAPWQPDAAAVAAKEKEILDYVMSGQVSEFDRSSMSKLYTLKDELLTLRTDPDEIQEALDLWDEIKALRDELEQRMKNMPHAIRNKVYGS